tara:strand:- start:3360 stop:3563 length:204 start_codon:yes stop_codon:yes gene_type:complete
MEPSIGTIWNGQGYKIQVIHKDDPKNINTDRSYKRSGKVIYEYLTSSVGKIGNCKTLEGFYACWNQQ